MSDFQIQVGGDFAELLRGFQQLEARAQQAGVNVGKGIGDGIQGYSSKSLAALQAELSRLQQRQVKVAVDSTAFDKTGERIKQVQALITEVERRRLTLGVDDRSITALQTKLAALQNRQVKLDVDSSEFAQAQREINTVEQELKDVSNRKLLINADPSSVVALRARLGDLQDELERTQIGSQRFRELTAAIKTTEAELAKAGESIDQFRLLDGVIQGVAFSLSNSLVQGAQSALAAIGGVVAEFGRLDTELRKAAAAGGEAGGYDRLARAVDQVGIEAAGTQLEVAQLATELVRGGMTIDQATTSLAAIVRGAEATGTSFANMGSVVSASLKGFGLEASDAQRVVDALVQGANASAASVDGMGMAFKYAAPVAKILGVSVEDLGVAIGLLTNAGIDASEAGVTLRNGLSKLASAAPQAGGAMQDLTGQSALAAKAMRSLGVDIYEANGTLKPMESTLIQLKGAFDKLEPSSKIRLAANLFGGEDDGAKWLALLNQSESEIRRMAATMANTKGATDVARDAMQGFELKLAQLNGTLGSLGNTFGSVAAAALTPFIDLANLAVGAISALPAPVKTTAAAMILLVGSLTAATVGMVVFQRALASTQVQATIAAVQSLAAAIRTNLAGAATVAIVAFDALVAALKGLAGAETIAALGQIGQGLRNLKAAEVVAGFQQLALAIEVLAARGKVALADLTARGVLAMRAGLASAAVALFDLALGMRGAAAASKAAEAGLTGTAAVLQGGMTAGAAGASNALAGLSRVLSQISTVTAGGAATGIRAFAASLAPAAASAAALSAVIVGLAPGILIFNKQMESARVAAANLDGSTAQLMEQMRDAGIVFQDFGTQGGPVQQMLTGVQRAMQSLIEEAKRLPYVSDAIKGVESAADTLSKINLLGWAKDASDAFRILFDEFSKNLGITKSVQNFEQLQEVIGKASEKTDAFILRLQQINSVPTDAIETWNEAYNKQRQITTDVIARLQEQKVAYEATIQAARQGSAATEIERQQKEDLIRANENLLRGVNADIKLREFRLSQLEKEGTRLGLVNGKIDEQARATAALAARVRELNTASAATGQALQVGQALQAYGQALADLEQSRFNIAKARGDYELQQAQQALAKQLEAAKARGASEAQIDKLRQQGETNLEAIRQQNRQIEAQALSAKFASLQRELQIQQQILQLSQQKAQQEANLAVAQARLQLAQAEKEVLDEQNKIFKDQGAIDAAKAKVIAAQDALAASQAQVVTLQQIQPLEQQVAAAKGETARNALVADAASKGLAVSAGNAAGATSQLAANAANAGVGFGQAAQGGAQLAGAAGQAANATAQASGQANALGGAMNAAANGANGVAGSANNAATGLQNAQNAAGGVASGMNQAAQAAGEAAANTAGVGASAQDSANKAKPLVDALGTGANAARLVATAQMARNISAASGSAGGLRNAMVAAAGAAREFYNWLSKASGLPGAYWTGGPIAAGQTVRINDGPAGRSLGQESFLTAAGKLSLINRPANSMWTAPSSGVVIPAAATTALKARGAFSSGRAATAAIAVKPDREIAATLAQQALAIGKLEQAVGRLAEKDWNVHLKVRSDTSSPHYLNHLNRMM